MNGLQLFSFDAGIEISPRAVPHPLSICSCLFEVEKIVILYCIILRPNKIPQFTNIPRYFLKFRDTAHMKMSASKELTVI